MRLEGKIALVTGGGSGIGRAIAQRFAEEGARVVVNDIHKDTAERAAAEIGAGRAHAIAADVADSAAVRTMFAEVARMFGGLDVLVNNAGIGEVESSGREAFADQGRGSRGRDDAGQGRDALGHHPVADRRGVGPDAGRAPQRHLPLHARGAAAHEPRQSRARSSTSRAWPG